MKKGAFYLLCLASLISCQNTSVRQIAEYTGRPILDGLPCINNDDGTCYRGGEIEESVNYLCAKPENWEVMQRHLERMERFYWACKKFKKCN